MIPNNILIVRLLQKYLKSLHTSNYTKKYITLSNKITAAHKYKIKI